MFVEISCCPFCRSHKIHIETWPTGSSWYCKNCKQEFLVQITKNGPKIESNLFYEQLRAIYEESIKTQQRTKPYKKKSKKRKSKKRKRR
jgi:hypothetical protein